MAREPRKTPEQEAAEAALRTKAQVSLLKRQAKINAARENLLDYIQITMPDIDSPGDVTRSQYVVGRPHRAICAAVQSFVEGGFPGYDILILTVPPRHGKALALDTPVPTPGGWTTMGALRPGDEVFSDTGEVCRVVARSPVWRDRPVFSVETDDGDRILADAKHVWRARLDRKYGAVRLHTTESLAARTSLRAPMLAAAGPLALPERALPVDPYVLGVWLGDGRTDTSAMCSNDQEIVDEVLAIEGGGNFYAPSGSTQHFRPGPHYRRGATAAETLQGRLKSLGVLGQKRIPESYLRASTAQRRACLQGLVDTDGYVAKDGQIEVCTILPGLAEDIRELVASLGHKASIVGGRAMLNGVDHGPKYRVMFYMAGAARLSRKAVKCRHGVRAFRRYISVTPAGRADTVCIQVDSPSAMFLCGRSMLPTHNSEIVSRRLPAWFSGRFPDKNVVVATYGDEFAADFGAEVRRIVHSPAHKQVFPAHKLVRGGTAKDRLNTTAGGLMFFVGRGAALTGRGAHLLVIDDLIKDDKEAGSQAIRDQAWNWLTRVAMTRRMGKHKPMILTFTRWHSDDPIGRLIDPENQFFRRELAERIKVINLPALAEEDDPLGRAPGEALWPDGPDSFDEEYLRRYRVIDPLGFASLYQQRPTLAEGDLFKMEGVRLYDAGDLPDNLRWYASSDHAVSTDQRRDPSCFGKAGVDKYGHLWLDELFWQRVASEVAVETMLHMGTGPRQPLIWWAERGHISKSLGPFLKKRMAETNRYFNVVEVTPIGDKASRAASAVARWNMGMIHLPAAAPWTERFIAELMAFPSGNHDDAVDMLSLLCLGLRVQVPASAPTAKNVEPKYGTLNWIRAQQKRDDADARQLRYGGF